MTQVDVKCYCQLYQKNLYAYKNSIFLFLAFSVILEVRKALSKTERMFIL